MTLTPKQWLKERRKGIGGSDAAAAVGLSPWKSKFTLWCEKTGQLEAENLDELEYIFWGKTLENPLARRYSYVTGRRTVNPGARAIRIHPEHDWMRCTIDRAIPFQVNVPQVKYPEYAQGDGDLSIKNVGFFKLEEWEEAPPVPYQIQMNHELAVTGMRWASFAVLIGGQHFRWLDMPRDEAAINTLIELEEEFWHHVKTGTPPPADDSDSTARTLSRLYPKAVAKQIALGVEFLQLARKRALLKNAAKVVSEKLQGIDNLIKAAIGEAEIGYLADGSGFSWKNQHRDGYSVPTMDFRVLREIKARKAR